MQQGQEGSGPRGRLRVHWSARSARNWCPGAARRREPAGETAPTGWTSYLHWSAVLGVLRERRGEPRENAPAPLATTPRAPLPQREPGSALPSLRRRSASQEPARDAWLEETPD